MVEFCTIYILVVCIGGEKPPHPHTHILSLNIAVNFAGVSPQNHYFFPHKPLQKINFVILFADHINF